MDGVPTAMENMTEPSDAIPEDDARGRDGPPAESPTEIQPHRVVEAVLLSADAPLPPARIASILGIGTARDVRRHVEALNRQYAELDLSFRIEHLAGGYQILTLPAYHTWIVKLRRARQETRLSAAALETLAIIAYKQPCTRAEIEAVRGVAAGDMLNRLREMNLIKIVGRAEDLGRPLLYGTTKRFLEVFGLPSLEDLPRVEALRSGAAPSPEPAPEATGDASGASARTDRAQAGGSVPDAGEPAGEEDDRGIDEELDRALDGDLDAGADAKSAGHVEEDVAAETEGDRSEEIDASGADSAGAGEPRLTLVREEGAASEPPPGPPPGPQPAPSDRNP